MDQHTVLILVPRELSNLVVKKKLFCNGIDLSCRTKFSWEVISQEIYAAQLCDENFNLQTIAAQAVSQVEELKQELRQNYNDLRRQQDAAQKKDEEDLITCSTHKEMVRLQLQVTQCNGEIDKLQETIRQLKRGIPFQPFVRSSFTSSSAGMVENPSSSQSSSQLAELQAENQKLKLQLQETMCQTPENQLQQKVEEANFKLKIYKDEYRDLQAKFRSQRQSMEALRKKNKSLKQRIAELQKNDHERPQLSHRLNQRKLATFFSLNTPFLYLVILGFALCSLYCFY